MGWSQSVIMQSDQQGDNVQRNRGPMGGGQQPGDRPVRHHCHRCHSRQAPEVLDSGELRCTACQNVGFVEILEGPVSVEEDPNAVITAFMQQVIHGMQGHGPADPRQNEFALSDFIQSVVTSWSAMEDTSNGPPPAAPSAIEGLRNITVENGSEWLKDSCVICQSQYEVGESLAKLNEDVQVCGHTFHRDCIVPWLSRHNSCPVCRYELPTADPSYEPRRLAHNRELQGRRQQGDGEGSPSANPKRD